MHRRALAAVARFEIGPVVADVRYQASGVALVVDFQEESGISAPIVVLSHDTPPPDGPRDRRLLLPFRLALDVAADPASAPRSVYYASPQGLTGRA